MSDDEVDVELLRRNILCRFNTQSLPDGESSLAFMFADLDMNFNLWLVVDGEDIYLCTADPSKNVNQYLASDLETVMEVWPDDTELKDALRDERILATGAKRLMRSLPDWFAICSIMGAKSMV